MSSVIYRLFGDRSCFLIKSTRLPSETSLPPPTRLTLPLSLILSLIFPTWVMAFVIPNDSRNKSTVMRSHWVSFFLSLKSPFTAPHSQPVPETQTGSCIRAPVNQQETDQFLPREDLPAAKMDTLSSWACVVFFQYPRLYYLLTHWSSYPGLVLMPPAMFPNSALWHL